MCRIEERVRHVRVCCDSRCVVLYGSSTREKKVRVVVGVPGEEERGCVIRKRGRVG